MSAQPQQSVQQNLNPAELFATFARDGFTLRDPAHDVIGMYCARAVGDCLEPLLTQGDIVWIDRAATPQHGDLVSFEWSKEVQESWKTDVRREAWIARFGPADFARGIKLFWRYPDERFPEQFRDDWLLTNDSARRLGDHKVLGVIRAVERGGKMLAGDIVHRVAMASIDPNAVSTVASITYSGPQTLLLPTSGAVQSYTFESASVTTTGSLMAVDATGEVTIAASSSVSSIVSCLLTIQRDGSNVGTAQFDALAALTNSGNLIWTSQVTLTIVDNPAAGAHTYALVGTGQRSGSTGIDQMQVSNISLKVREYKR